MSLLRAEAIVIRRQTGYTPSAWARKLDSLYRAAKRRAGGRSLTIYGRVSAMLDILEGIEPAPQDFDLGAELNNLAGDLRRC